MALSAALSPSCASDVTEVRNSNSSLFKRYQESSPVNLCFGQSGGNPEDHAFGVVATNADGDEHGTVAHGSIDADFDVSGVNDKMGDPGQLASAPLLEGFVELGGQARDLCGADFQAAELLHHPGDSASGNALEIHLRDGRFKRAVHP